MPMAVPVNYTAEMVRALPDDGNRYESVHGELLVTPAPRPWHQIVLGRLHMALARYLEDHPVGIVLTSPADISWSEDTLVQPDLFVARTDEVRTLAWKEIRTLLLVVEILSPTTSRADRFTKRRLYQEVGVPLYWVLDPEANLVEVWTPGATLPSVERERLEWGPPGVGQPFSVPLAQLFRPI